MAINPIWKKKEKYTLCEITYIACDKDPVSVKEACRNPEYLLERTYSDILNYLNKKEVVDQNGYLHNYDVHDANDSFYKYQDKLEFSYSKKIAIEIIDYLGEPNFLKDIPVEPLPEEFIFNDETEAGDEVPDGVRDKQLKAIGIAAISLGYFDLKNIPVGGKKAIKEICEKDTELFKTHSFNHAWKKGNELEYFSIENKEQFK